MLAFRAQEKDVEILVHYPLDIPNHFIGDATRLRQVLNNLAGNAVKFTEQGHVILSVRMTEQNENIGGLVCSVSDTGIGIASDHVETIFEQFSQADESTTRKFGGSGLGLSISKQLVHLMGGSIQVASELGKGSTFSFTIALPCSDEPGPSIVPDEALAVIRILVVDDNEINREIAEGYLRQKGISCDTAHSAEEALYKLKEAQASGDPFHLAIVDFRMPEADGGQLAANIKRDKDIQDSVLVLLSSYIPVNELDQKIR